MLELLNTARDPRPVLLSIDREIELEKFRVTGQAPSAGDVAKAVEQAQDRAPAVGATHPRLAQALKMLDLQAAYALLHGLIPEGAPVLNENPEVAEARRGAVAIIQEFARAGGIPTSYVFKHLRNVLTRGTGKTPEQLISDLSHGQSLPGLLLDQEGMKGLGKGKFWAGLSKVVGAVASIGGTVVAVVGAVKSPPGSGQFQQPAQPQGVNPQAVQPYQYPYPPPPAAVGGVSGTTLALVGGGVAVAGLAVVLLTRRRR
jgi:hypothetical protein